MQVRSDDNTQTFNVAELRAPFRGDSARKARHFRPQKSRYFEPIYVD